MRRATPTCYTDWYALEHRSEERHVEWRAERGIERLCSRPSRRQASPGRRSRIRLRAPRRRRAEARAPLASRRNRPPQGRRQDKQLAEEHRGYADRASPPPRARRKPCASRTRRAQSVAAVCMPLWAAVAALRSERTATQVHCWPQHEGRFAWLTNETVAFRGVTLRGIRSGVAAESVAAAATLWVAAATPRRWPRATRASTRTARCSRTTGSRAATRTAKRAGPARCASCRNGSRIRCGGSDHAVCSSTPCRTCSMRS